MILHPYFYHAHATSLALIASLLESLAANMHLLQLFNTASHVATLIRPWGQCLLRERLAKSRQIHNPLTPILLPFCHHVWTGHPWSTHPCLGPNPSSPLVYQSVSSTFVTFSTQSTWFITPLCQLRCSPDNHLLKHHINSQFTRLMQKDSISIHHLTPFGSTTFPAHVEPHTLHWGHPPRFYLPERR